MADPILALTLLPEWAWAICAPGWPSDCTPRRVENRSWRPNLLPGVRLAIHAGAHLGGRPGIQATGEALTGVHDMFRRANPSRWHPYDNWTVDLGESPRSAIVAIVTIDSFDRLDLTGWDVPGAWHWRLRDVVVLPEPIPCRGAQGLWRPAPEVQQRLVEVSRG